MSDSFVIWITWLLSATGTVVVLSLVNLKSSLSDSTFLSISAASALLVSSISVFVAMKVLSPSKTSDAAELISVDDSGKDGVALRSVLMVSGSATIALAIGIGIVTLVNAGYSYLYPPKNNPFGIYDI